MQRRYLPSICHAAKRKGLKDGRDHWSPTTKGHREKEKEIKIKRERENKNRRIERYRDREIEIETGRERERDRERERQTARTRMRRSARMRTRTRTRERDSRDCFLRGPEIPKNTISQPPILGSRRAGLVNPIFIYE